MVLAEKKMIHSGWNGSTRRRNRITPKPAICTIAFAWPWWFETRYGCRDELVGSPKLEFLLISFTSFICLSAPSNGHTSFSALLEVFTAFTKRLFESKQYKQKTYGVIASAINSQYIIQA